ncbi:hypothetical protein K2173_006453 [Erythroxylum novogranatense]|uniref:Uncharacterized protein n=1 Tax=Erythroxylum novogranatense TaxID=1862640 RepID=A0AAV8TDU6_9ROSI|nr:hypothetical protein K2173_006453 [Erythroxylum novogranatense]
MSSLGTSKGILEIAKFGIYVTIPIFLMYTFANNSKNLQKFMGSRSYVVYPPRDQGLHHLRSLGNGAGIGSQEKEWLISGCCNHSEVVALTSLQDHIS